MIKVLFAVPSFPLPAHSGGAIATFETLRSIAGGCKLHLLTPEPPTDRNASLAALEDALPGLTVHFYQPREQQLPRFEMYTTAALTTVTRKSYWAMSWRNRELRFAVQRLFAEHKFDVVHAEWLQTAVSIWDLTLPLLIRTLDVHFLGMQEWSQNIPASDRLRRAFWGRQAERFRVFEARILSSASAIVCLSKEDEVALRAQGVTKIQTIPPPRSFEPAAKSRVDEGPDRCMALFVGRLDMPVNKEGFYTFMNQIWPKAGRNLRDQCRVVFAGGFPDDSMRERAADGGIELLAPLPDLDAKQLFKRADLFFSPVHSGTGIKIKTIEAMAQGKAMLGFRNAFRGVPAEEGRDMLVAESPEDFATLMEKLVFDKSLREQLGSNAQQFVQENFNPVILGSRLLDLYHKVAADALPRNQVRSA